jgi:asparagine synthase (glutamine-hydrolysing)
MCGIAGVFSRSSLDEHKINNKLDLALEALENRGPDSYGKYISENFAFAHARLSIQDTTQLGSQPMVSECGRYVIVFNGEIYNFKQLREMLLNTHSASFKTDCDTEVLLKLLIHLELPEVLNLLEGMYAFCFYDLFSKKAILARDKFGQKPLYYSHNDENFCFSSTIEGLKKVSSNDESFILNTTSINDYIAAGFILQPNSVYTNVRQLNRNSILEFNFSDFSMIETKLVKSSVNIKSKNNSLAYAIERSVNSCLVSDVEVGSFLSGGIDSSLISYYASKQSTLKTFCVGFKNKNYDESIFAEKIAEKIGSDHHSYYVSDDEILDIVNSGHSIFGEPFSDPSFIPLVALSKFARSKVKVALTGDGGDELFYGYNRHVHCNKIQNISNNFFLKGIIATAVKFPGLIEGVGGKFGFKALSEKLSKLNMLVSSNEEDLYWSFLKPDKNIKNPDISMPLNKSLIEAVREMDIEYYQLSNTLVKSDRSSMYSGIELRAPFLENDVVQFVNDHVSYNNEIIKGHGKHSLRHLAYDLMGRELLDRPKSGFTPPLMDWLKGPLNQWAIDGLLAASKSGLCPVGLPKKIDPMESDYLYYLNIWRYSVLGHWIEKNRN